MTKRKTLAWCGTVSALALMAAGARAEDTIADALAASKPIVESSLRAETVSQSGFAEKAEALTWRNRLGFQSGDFHNFKALVEFENVVAPGGAYNSLLNGKTAFPTVPDPEVTELNRAQIVWSPSETTALTVGRQRFQLDDQRFIGNVGWRQDEQTLDAVRLDTTLWRVRLTAAYVGKVNRVIADQKDWNSTSWLINAGYSVNEALKFTAFDYDFRFSTAATAPTAGDINNARISSVRTAGLRAYGGGWVSAFKLAYAAQYATQKNAGLNPAVFTLHESMLEAQATYDIYSLKVNYEALEGNGTVGFITPLGTVHAFEGFADVFASTGGNKTFADGIDDLNATFSIAGHTKPWAPWVINPTLTVIYHDLKTDRMDRDIGKEWDAVLAAGITKNLSVMLKYADFQAADSTMPASRTKTWLMFQYKL